MCDSDSLKKLLEKNQIGECIERLKHCLEEKGFDHLKDDLLVIGRSFSSIEQDRIRNQRDPRELDRDLNRITSSIVALISKIGPEENLIESTPQQKSSTNFHVGNKRYKLKLIQIEEYLKRSDFENADLATTNLFLIHQNSDLEYPSLDKVAIQNFPLGTLINVNSLWEKYSNEKFGFSIQEAIWETLNGPDHIFKTKYFHAFGEYVGWKGEKDWLQFYQNFCFSIEAPLGHFPSLWQPDKEKSMNWWYTWKENIETMISITRELP